MARNISDNGALTLGILALITLACAWLFTYTNNPPPAGAKNPSGIEEFPHRPETADIGPTDIPQPVIHTQNPANQEFSTSPDDYGPDWGIVPPELIESGQVDAASARVLNEATIQFAGSAAQADAVQTGQ